MLEGAFVIDCSLVNLCQPPPVRVGCRFPKSLWSGSVNIGEDGSYGWEVSADKAFSWLFGAIANTGSSFCNRTRVSCCRYTFLLLIFAVCCCNSVFGEDALVNVSVEKKDDNKGKLAGYIRIRSKTQGIALSLGDRITSVQRGLPEPAKQ
jgi:Coatomer beta subunit appendage platform